jgi:hypothetical protein
MAQQWFVYPVENGVELVVDSSDGDVYDAALAAFVEVYTDYNVAAEWSVPGAEIISFVPAPDIEPIVPVVNAPGAPAAEAPVVDAV